MEIVMIETATGCDDGIRQKTYEAGETYQVSEGLAKCFFDMKVAKSTDKKTQVEEKAAKPDSNKALDNSNYQNKAVKPKQSKGDEK